MRYDYTAIRMANAGGDGKKPGPTCIAGGNAECHPDKQAVSHKTPQPHAPQRILCSHRNPYVDVLTGFTRNSPKLETPRCPTVGEW